MKMMPNDTMPLVKKPKYRGGKAPDPNSLRSRCKAAGVKVSATTIADRMERYGFTFEEAVKFNPMDNSAKGRRSKKRRKWGMGLPPEEIEAKKAEERAKPHHRGGA